jgi:hypothetical protein
VQKGTKSWSTKRENTQYVLSEMTDATTRKYSGLKNEIWSQPSLSSNSWLTGERERERDRKQRAMLFNTTRKQ